MWDKINIEMTDIFEWIFKIGHNFLEIIKIENQAVWSFNIAENLKTVLLYFDMKSNKIQNVILGRWTRYLKIIPFLLMKKLEFVCAI